MHEKLLDEIRAAQAECSPRENAGRVAEVLASAIEVILELEERIEVLEENLKTSPETQES
jgi:hypothetical protein